MKVRSSGFSCLVAVAAVALGVVLSGCVWGVVRDIETGAPIEGALVTFQDEAGNSGSTYSGPGGLYAFDSARGQPIPAVTGKVVYQASAPGYDLLTLDHFQTMSMPRTVNQVVPFSLVPLGNRAPLPGCRGITVSWAYQPDGSADLANGVITGRSCMDGWENKGFKFDTEGDPAAGYDLSFSCRAMYHGYFPWGPAFWTTNEVSGAHDMGSVSFDELTSAPDKSQGVGDHKFYNSQGVRAITDHVYAIVTADGKHYAKIEVEASSCGFGG